VDLRHAAVVAMTRHTAQRNHIQPEFVLRQSDHAFLVFFRAPPGCRRVIR
jgi:hypothetical protein